MSAKFDVILWGATGFTGSLVAEYLLGAYGASGEKLRWAIAGRNKEKLTELRGKLANIDADAAGLELLTADSDDGASLAALAEQTKVICTTVGPYYRYGSKLVEACVDAGIGYCDLTGEAQWIKANIDNYHARAVSSGARIVHSCGFDSIPSDLGVQLVQDTCIERYGQPAGKVSMLVKSMKGGFSGGTAASMLLAMESARADPEVRRALANPYALLPAGSPKGPRIQEQSGPRFDEDFDCWTAPFIMEKINTRIVLRSNGLQEFRYGNDFRYSESLATGRGMKGRLRAISTTVGLGGFVLGAALGPTRSLLKNFVLPEPGEGPSREEREAGKFRLAFVAKTSKEGQEVRAEVGGNKDPGYGMTSRMLGETAVCLALDAEQLPNRGGILTPAVAMGPVLRARLEQVGMYFNVL